MMCLMVSCIGPSSTKALFSTLEDNAGLGEIVKQIERGADVNAVDDREITPLNYAISKLQQVPPVGYL